MKKFPFLLFCLFFMVLGCEQRKQISNEEFYGNSFIRVNMSEDFKAPDTWESMNLFDSAFHIQIPNYMKLSQTVPIQDGCQSVIFTYNDTTNSEDFHYGRIGIDYYKYSTPKFSKATENLDYHDREALLKPLITAALKGGQKISDKIVAQDGEVINGPFYDTQCFFYRGNGKYAQCFASDGYYRRNGHVKGGSPVSTHIYLLMNSTESAVITVSHYDKDSLIFENMFKIIKTFNWNNVHF